MLEFVDGNTAILRAAIDAGCSFFAGYPITPATSILLEAVRELPAHGGVVIQGEDEIASIGMCLAASMAGRKAMTATSGPGMSLFSETIGLAVMGEVPIVIVDVQRMGPATGGATTSADGDIQFARWCAPGGYPMPVLAPTDVTSAYLVTRRAFDIAERLRTPVLVLSSKEVAMTRQTVDLDAARDSLPVPVERSVYRGAGPFVPYRVEQPEDIPEFSAVGGDHVVRFTTSMHDERGEITGDPAKIVRKLVHLERKIRSDDGLALTTADIQAGAETLVIAYGVAAVSARDAVDELRAAGGRASLLVVESLWPVPEARILEAARGHQRIVVPEHNFGQYAREIERLVRDVPVISLPRIDGGMLSPSEIRAAIESGSGMREEARR